MTLKYGHPPYPLSNEVENLASRYYSRIDAECGLMIRMGFNCPHCWQLALEKAYQEVTDMRLEGDRDD